MRRLDATILLAVCAVGHAAPVAAEGRWNMPTTYCQCLGWGHGPGYHADMILGPWKTADHRQLHRCPCPPAFQSCFGPDCVTACPGCAPHYWQHSPAHMPAPHVGPTPPSPPPAETLPPQARRLAPPSEFAWFTPQNEPRVLGHVVAWPSISTRRPQQSVEAWNNHPF